MMEENLGDLDAEDFTTGKANRKRNSEVTNDAVPADIAGADVSSSKRKRSIPSKFKQPEPEISTAPPRIISEKRPRKTDSSNMKRPRGRPPAGLKMPAAPPQPASTGARSSNKSQKATDNQAPLSSSPRDSAHAPTAQAQEDNAKIPRPHAAIITHRILTRLMTEGPLTVAELQGTAFDGPTRDTVQSILDVLQIFCLVTQLKVQDTAPGTSSSPAPAAEGNSTATNPADGTSNATATATATADANSVVYAMAGIAKGPEYTTLSKLSAVAREKRANAAAVRKRIERLQAIALLDSSVGSGSGSGVGPAEKADLLKSTIEGFCASEESLSQDPLFRAVLDAVNKKKLVPTAAR
jgi:hypothetical protein